MGLRADEQVTKHTGSDNEGQENHGCYGQAHKGTNAEPPHVAVLVGEEAVRVVAAVLVVAEAAAEDRGRLAPRPRAAEAAHHLLLRAHVARASAAHRAPHRARRHLGPPDVRASEEPTETKLSQRKTESEGEKSREKQRDRERRGERLGDAAAGDLESLRTEKGHQFVCLIWT